MQTKYIVYACPVGELADQLERYFATSQATCGPNAAHDYMPHCSLTGFFHDQPEAVELYRAALDAALQRARAIQPPVPLTIIDMKLTKDFHGLRLSSPWLQALVDYFALTASPTRTDAIRRKDGLHLSLAYHFPPKQHTPLAKLARELVDIAAPVGWELRLYEQHSDKSWVTHASWPL